MQNVIYFQSYWRRILILFLLFVLGAAIAMAVAGMIQMWLPANERAAILASSIAQNLLWFAMCPLAAPVFFCTKPLQYVGVTQGITLRQIIGVVIVFIIALPALDQVIYYNANMTLPQSLSGLEQAFREMEEQASQVTELILSGNTVGTLITNLLVIAILTGVCEELLFRGGVQRVLMSGKMNPHTAIWIAAIIFSLLHGQMFGFVPRLLLGAFFGYLYYWSGSIWLSSFAHALNNSSVVVLVWLQHRGILDASMDAEGIGVTVNGIPWVAISSAVILTAFLLVGRKYFFKKQNNVLENRG